MAKANSATFQKAERLRAANEKVDKKQEKIVLEWTNKRRKAKTKEERARLDAVYGKRSEVVEKQESKTYKAYYDYVHDNFSRAEIDTARKESGSFMKKSFLQKLFAVRKDKQPKPKTTKRKTSTAKPKTKKPTKRKTAPKKKK